MKYFLIIIVTLALIWSYAFYRAVMKDVVISPLPEPETMEQRITRYTKECNAKGGMVFTAGDWLHGSYMGCNLPKE